MITLDNIEYYTRAEAAQKLHLSPTQFGHYLRTNPRFIQPARMQGNSYLFLRYEVERFARRWLPAWSLIRGQDESNFK